MSFATKHNKGQAAQSPFARILGAKIIEHAIDSDQMGTFSGEVERPGSMLDALRGKVRLAREHGAGRFVLVSEGSFSSLDGFGVIPQGLEMLLLHDAESGVEAIEQYVTTETNYGVAQIRTLSELETFLERISFGDHAVVIYPAGVSLRDGTSVWKGITQRGEAEAALQSCCAASPLGESTVMSDMRADKNPTRMRSIARCCELMAHRLATPCPRCKSGGFGLVEMVRGLPCEWCGAATSQTRAERHRCVVCKTTRDLPRADGKEVADPGGCERCNP